MTSLTQNVVDNPPENNTDTQWTIIPIKHDMLPTATYKKAYFVLELSMNIHLEFISQEN